VRVVAVADVGVRVYVFVHVVEVRLGLGVAHVGQLVAVVLGVRDIEFVRFVLFIEWNLGYHLAVVGVFISFFGLTPTLHNVFGNASVHGLNEILHMLLFYAIGLLDFLSYLGFLCILLFHLVFKEPLFVS